MNHLFDTASWIPRAQCGYWPGWLVSLSVVSDLFIWFSYQVIALSISYVLLKRAKGIPFGWLGWFFVAFIFACGWTHAADALMFYKPYYNLTTVILVATGLISLSSMGFVVMAIPKVIKWKTPREIAKLEEYREARVREIGKALVDEQVESTRRNRRVGDV